MATLRLLHDDPLLLLLLIFWRVVCPMLGWWYGRRSH